MAEMNLAVSHGLRLLPGFFNFETQLGIDSASAIACSHADELGFTFGSVRLPCHYVFNHLRRERFALVTSVSGLAAENWSAD